MTKGYGLHWVIAAAALPTSAHGQGVRGSIDQIGSSSSAPVEQISTAVRRSDRARSGAALQDQISASGEARSTSAQVTAERGNQRGSAQLYTGGRTAEPADPLSKPSEGRTGAVAAVGGDDRCDPALRSGLPEDKACARVIERRAGEFVRRNNEELTLEQKLLVEQRTNQPSTTREAARQLGDTGADTGSLEAQGIAAVVLRGGNVPPETGGESDSADPAVNAAALNAIVSAIAAGANGGSPR
ncbi:hypothetical protein [Sphingosinicella sp. BN140058]|uniref:hypothetical protein n=1 Tax=Sphingosinicella sp. BN140058 TaxID=1892855 RepID=UPI0010137E1C|nr:hypothetical protein [Sphingosinicella sp. BN140058]QAY79206.1 hypothetical protein ETR14_23695 [Sphingosinicella sp. BN140058]